MRASEAIRQIWGRFHGIPMETFTKGWWLKRCGGVSRQRTVVEMMEHRRLLGAGGNCFDLALWLRHEFLLEGMPARIIGHDLLTADAHVAVLVGDPSGTEYLCDLGDLWLQPILVTPGHPAYSTGWHSGFFPGRLVQIARSGNSLKVCYRRASGKEGSQGYDLDPISVSTGSMIRRRASGACPTARCSRSPAVRSLTGSHASLHERGWRLT